MSGPNYPPVPNTTKIELRYVAGGPFGGVVYQNDVYWFDDVATHNALYLSQLVADVVTWWAEPGSLSSVLNDDIVLDRVKAIDLDDVAHLYVQADVGAPGEGGTSPVLPLTVAGVVRFPGSLATEPRQVYVRWGPLAEAAVSGNTILSANRTEISDAWVVFFNGLVFAQPDGVPVGVSVFEPKASGGGTPSTLYRDTGIVNPTNIPLIAVRGLVGRAVSRQS